MAQVKAPEVPPEPTEAAEAAQLEVPPEIVAQSLRQYFAAWLARIRSGDSGILPVVFGLIIITIVFQIISPNNVFLTAGNLVNLFQQSAIFMVFAMGEIFALLLGEIDLSISYVGAVGAVVAVQLVQPVTTNWPWWAAIIAGLLVCALIGAAQGTIISRLGIPAFIVTLAGFLIWNGVMLILLGLGPFSGYPSLSGRGTNLKIMYDLMWGNINTLWSWIGMAVVVALLGGWFWFRDQSRRRSGLVAPPTSLTLMKIVLIAVVGVAVVLVCSINRAATGYVAGVPVVIPIVLVVLGAWTILLQRTRYGRYVYAIGGNPEAARRAGINLARIRTSGFVLCSLTGGIAGLLYASYQVGMSNNFEGGELVLYAVGAAVIGGTSLIGGRGKVMHGVLGGLVIGGIFNGMYLLGLTVEWLFIVTGLVLLAALTIDALSRRSAASGSAARV